MQYLFKNFTTLFFALFLTFSLGVISCGDSSSGGGSAGGGDGTKYKVTLTQPEHGSISANPAIPSDGKVAEGTPITFTATPDTGYGIAGWSGAVVDGNNPNVATLTVSADVTVSATIIPEGFVKVVTPEGAFTTTLDTSTDPSSSNPIYIDESSWKGVFYKDRNVKLSSFCIGKTEVTYELWKEVYDWATLANGGTAGGQGQPAEQYYFAHVGTQGSDGDTGNVNHPVTEVSWRDCVVWCNAYTEKLMGEDHCVYRVDSATGAVIKDARTANASQVDAAFAAMDKKGFRLPTEAEWEFATRYERGEENNDDGTAVPYSAGLWLTKLTFASGATADYTDVTATGNVAWYSGNSGNKTHAVGTTTVATNNLGLSDMSGNVWEWCFDRYDDATSNDEAYEQTIGGETVVVDPLGAGSGSNRVYRGGSWNNDAEGCTAGARGPDSPDFSAGNLGFRLACRP